MIVYQDIAFALDRQIKKTMHAEKGQHMIQKRYIGIDCGLSCSVKDKLQLNIRFSLSFVGYCFFFSPVSSYGCPALYFHLLFTTDYSFRYCP